MSGIPFTEGREQMILNYVLSKPVGFAVGLLYVAEASSGIQCGPEPDIVRIFTNYVAPIGLVVYFLLRDEKRDKLAAKAETDQRKIEAAKDESRARETADREERMAKQIDVLENYINKTMFEVITESKSSVTLLCEKIDTLIHAMKRSDCPLINGKVKEKKEENPPEN